MIRNTCQPDLIEDFLADRLDDAQQAAFELHLDECDECCRRLHHDTADVRLWDDARNYLSSPGEPLTSIGLSDCDNGLAADTAELRLDFLAPTDDPRMLGRFAGYEVSGVIGCGGMGIVLKGFDTALNRYAAIKVLAPHYAGSGAARKRFAREAQAAAAVVHDNVIAIHGVDEFNGLPYLIMPYVKGESLQKRIDREGPLAVEELLRIASQTAKGLGAAHDQGLVHRDIKPANILLPENVERVMITDFGLARAADDASLTRSGIIAGTPQYMSPEQARGDLVDARSDLFSLGSVMYAMSTGHPAFSSRNPVWNSAAYHGSQSLARISETRPDFPRWLERVVIRLLEKNPARRFSSVMEVASLLNDCLAHVQQPRQTALPKQLRHSSRTHQLNLKSGLCVALAAAVLVAAALAVFSTLPLNNQTGKQQSAQSQIAAPSGDETETEERTVSIRCTGQRRTRSDELR